MPSIAELSGQLGPRQALALEGSIESQSRAYQATVQERGYEDAPTEFVAFTIPLDSHLPLPLGYTSTVHIPHEQSASMTIVHHAALETKLGREKLTAILTALVVGIGNEHTATPLADLDEFSIMALYREAIRHANHTIMAFKLTPDMHNHDLRPVTVMNRPSFVDMFRFDTTLGQILEAGTVQMHHNLVKSVDRASRAMNPSEHDEFRKYFQMLGMHDDEPSTNILATICQAIDEVCIGNYASGLVLADTYTEHFMRYALLRLYAAEGLSDEAAMSKVDNMRSLDKLLGGLAVALRVTQPELKQSIAFGVWREACREKRNHITHRFTKLAVEPGEARAALRETIRMVSVLARCVVGAQTSLAPHMRLFETPSWYINSIEAYDAHDGRALSRVTDIVKYQYLKPDGSAARHKVRWSRRDREQ